LGSEEKTGFIFNLFNECLFRYTAIQFTKNVEKYVKYTPEEVKKKLSALFDLSA
jgi:hypothetical protein